MRNECAAAAAFYFSVCFSGWETRVREYYYIYIRTQRPTLRIVLPLPLWLDRQLHHSKCVCCAFDALGRCNNQMMGGNKWKKDERVELFNQRLPLRSDEHFPPKDVWAYNADWGGEIITIRTYYTCVCVQCYAGRIRLTNGLQCVQHKSERVCSISLMFKTLITCIISLCRL